MCLQGLTWCPATGSNLLPSEINDSAGLEVSKRYLGGRFGICLRRQLGCAGVRVCGAHSLGCPGCVRLDRRQRVCDAVLPCCLQVGVLFAWLIVLRIAVYIILAYRTGFRLKKE